jgi:hypothetical protein
MSIVGSVSTKVVQLIWQNVTYYNPVADRQTILKDIAISEIILILHQSQLLSHVANHLDSQTRQSS